MCDDEVVNVVGGGNKMVYIIMFYGTRKHIQIFILLLSASKTESQKHNYRTQVMHNKLFE